mmetsp:Transcript_8160/g.9487  ORF Transcript_8160/g.9487 Transcript_8160/m.9487 type:complete len:226 (+) Transcript_8160:64-741(+)
MAPLRKALPTLGVKPAKSPLNPSSFPRAIRLSMYPLFFSFSDSDESFPFPYPFLPVIILFRTTSRGVVTICAMTVAIAPAIAPSAGDRSLRPFVIDSYDTNLITSAGYAYRIFSQYPVYNSERLSKSLIVPFSLLSNVSLTASIAETPSPYPSIPACCRTFTTSDGFRTSQYGICPAATAKEVLNHMGIVDVLGEFFMLVLTESLTAKNTAPAGIFESNVRERPL